MWIRLKNMQLYGYHGVHAFEREHGARFEIDVEVEADLEKAAANDEITETIDYVKLQQAVGYVVTTKQYHLVETLSREIAEHVLTQFPVNEVIVRVRKPGASVGGILDTVEVECRKAR